MHESCPFDYGQKIQTETLPSATKRLTLLRDSCIQGHPPKLRDDERAEEFLRAWNFFGEGLIVKDLKPESMEVTVAYRPRPQFLPFHSRAERFACIVTHRRAGKTVACIQDLHRAALTCERIRVPPS
jgi:hypothetical protein